MGSQKYYAVFKGRKTGIFTSWAECEEQINGFKGAAYKSFKTRGEAEEALGLISQATIFPLEQEETSNQSSKEIMPATDLMMNSICVDASCLGNPGDVEYRGVHLETGEVIFHKRPMQNGTNNLGEFLAIVHALAHLKREASDIPIYSDSETAILWIRNKKVKTNLQRTGDNNEIFDLVERALIWLENNHYNNPILKWNTQSWGEIPADFGRKQNSHNKFQPQNHLEVHKDDATTQSKSLEIQLQITISGDTFRLKEQLKQAGLSWDGWAWTGHLPATEIEKLKQFCCTYDLQYAVSGPGIKETRLPRGSRPVPKDSIAAVMGDGKFQWAIEETIAIEKLRSRQNQSKKRKHKR